MAWRLSREISPSFLPDEKVKLLLRRSSAVTMEMHDGLDLALLASASRRLRELLPAFPSSVIGACDVVVGKGTQA